MISFNDSRTKYEKLMILYITKL